MIPPSQPPHTSKSSYTTYGVLGLHLLIVAAVIAYGLAIFSETFVPEKYRRDARGLHGFIEYTPINLLESPFGKTAALFRQLGLTGSPAIVGVIAVTMFLFVVWRCIPAGRTQIWPTAILGASTVLAGLYLGNYSKEFFVVPLIIFAVSLKEHWAWEAAWLATVFGYAAVLRANWTAVAVVYIAFRLILHFSRSWRSFVVYTTLLIAGLAVAFQIVYGLDLHFHRYIVGESLSPDINTAIVDPITGGGVFGSFLNGVYSFFVMLIPLPLALFASPIYLAAAGLVGGMWFTLFRKLFVALKGPRSNHKERYWRSMCLLLAFTLVQSLYAPDWGAYIRHITPILPLGAWCLGQTLSARGVRRAQSSREVASV